MKVGEIGIEGEKEREKKRRRERDMTGHNYSWKPETMAAAALKEA